MSAVQTMKVDAANGVVYRMSRGLMKPAKTFRCGAYLQICVGGRSVNVARFIYAHAHGPIPPWLVVDHISRNTLDNRIENLRLVSQKQNNENRLGPQRNNKIGFKGVCSVSRSGRYRAQIKHEGKKLHLGCFGTPEEAYAAYCNAARELHSCNPHGQIAI